MYRTLPDLTQLHLQSNQVGDIGISALVRAMDNGALSHLTDLNLEQNQIGDLGMITLAAVGNEKMTFLQTCGSTKTISAILV